MTEGTLAKAALVEQVADVADITKKRAEVIVETVFGSIAEALRREEKVELRSFDSFRLRLREPRRGRNPRTGDRVEVASKQVAYFTPGKELREQINRDPAQSVPRPLSELPVSDRRSPPTRAGSLCERRVKSLRASSAPLRPWRVTRRSRRLRTGYGRPYPSGHRPLAGLHFGGHGWERPHSPGAGTWSATRTDAENGDGRAPSPFRDGRICRERPPRWV